MIIFDKEPAYMPKCSPPSTTIKEEKKAILIVKKKMIRFPDFATITFELSCKI
jgi:hypothetical protein